MFRSLARSAFGLVAAVALFAAPSAAKAQYVSPGVGISVATPGLGINLGFGGPVYRPVPVVAPAYPVYPPVYPVYASRPVVVPAPFYGSYYGGYRPYGSYYGPNHGHMHGRPY